MVTLEAHSEKVQEALHRPDREQRTANVFHQQEPTCAVHLSRQAA
jgi:hypothetical protein